MKHSFLSPDPTTNSESTNPFFIIRTSFKTLFCSKIREDSEFVASELGVGSGEQDNCQKIQSSTYLTQHVDRNQVFGYLHRGWCHQYKNDIEHSCNLQEPKQPLKNKMRIIF